MRTIALLALIGCGGAQPAAPQPIDNKVPQQTAPEPVVGAGCKVRGVVLDSHNGEPTIGATMVFSGGATTINEQVMITGNAGEFDATLEPGHSKLTVYYLDQTVERRFDPGFCGKRLRVPFDAATPSAPIVVY